jgi:hypothetical protein
MVGLTAIAEGVTAAILKFGWRIARTFMRSKKVDEPFGPSDLDAITKGIGDQLTRLGDEAAFLPADQRPIPTQIEEEDAPQFRIRRPSLLQLARNVQPRQIIVLK